MVRPDGQWEVRCSYESQQGGCREKAVWPTAIVKDTVVIKQGVCRGQTCRTTSRPLVCHFPGSPSRQAPTQEHPAPRAQCWHPCCSSNTARRGLFAFTVPSVSFPSHFIIQLFAQRSVLRALFRHLHLEELPCKLPFPLHYFLHTIRHYPKSYSLYHLPHTSGNHMKLEQYCKFLAHTSPINVQTINTH